MDGWLNSDPQPSVERPLYPPIHSYPPPPDAPHPYPPFSPPLAPFIGDGNLSHDSGYSYPSFPRESAYPVAYPPLPSQFEGFAPRPHDHHPHHGHHDHQHSFGGHGEYPRVPSHDHSDSEVMYREAPNVYGQILQEESHAYDRHESQASRYDGSHHHSPPLEDSHGSYHHSRPHEDPYGSRHQHNPHKDSHGSHRHSHSHASSYSEEGYGGELPKSSCPSERGPLVKVFCKANTDFNLAVRHDGVVMVKQNIHDESQHWILDQSWSTRVKDSTGQPAFMLINKASNQALKHATEAAQQVLVTNYFPGTIDESILWTNSEDMGEGFRTIRMANNILLNLDALKGDKKSGGVREGTPAILFKWKKQENQLWKMTPL